MNALFLQLSENITVNLNEVTTLVKGGNFIALAMSNESRVSIELESVDDDDLERVIKKATKELYACLLGITAEHNSGVIPLTLIDIEEFWNDYVSNSVDANEMVVHVCDGFTQHRDRVEWERAEPDE